MEQYFDAPQEDDVADNGKEEVVHNVDMKEVDRTFLTDRVEGIAGKIPELDARIDEVAQGWKTGRMGKVELTICARLSTRCYMTARYLPRLQSMRQ